jgi:hypothetical protein
MVGKGDLAPVSLKEHGAQHFCGAVTDDLLELHAALGHLPKDNAGFRINCIDRLTPILRAEGSIGLIAQGIMGDSARAVRAILFDKTAKTNWSLGWHQDRTICVKRRIDIDGFGPWTLKRGLQHVAPPFCVLSRMVTLRVHLDDVPATNAPLLIALGSHTKGRVLESEIQEVVKQSRKLACLAEAGDVWAYSTPILHASDVASLPTRRRVLQLDYAAEDLPGGLEWLGV